VCNPLELCSINELCYIELIKMIVVLAQNEHSDEIYHLDTKSKDY